LVIVVSRVVCVVLSQHR